MADVRFRVRWRDEDARGAIRSLQGSVDALRGDVNRLGAAFQAATGPASRFGTTTVTQMRNAEIASGGLLRNVRSMRSAFSGLFIGGGVALAARQFGRLNDAAINTQSLLRQITNSSQEFEASQARIYQLALDLRTPVAAISTLYTRTALALGDAYDPRRVEQFTRAVAQLGRASGATQQEFVNATRQLTQGLGSGRLAGDELRGVLEGLPAVGRALADELGVAFGELRQLGRTGQLTPQIVFGALSGEGVAETAQAAFEEVGLTFEQVFGNFTSRLQEEFTKIEGNTELLGELNITLQDFAPKLVGVGEAITRLVNTLGIIPSLATLLGLAAAPSAISALSSRRRNIFGASANITELNKVLSGNRPLPSSDTDAIRRGLIYLGGASRRQINVRIDPRTGRDFVPSDDFVERFGRVGREARLGEARRFRSLLSALAYLDRVGAGGTQGIRNTGQLLRRQAATGAAEFAVGAPRAVFGAAELAGRAATGPVGFAAAGGIFAYGFYNALTTEYGDRIATFWRRILEGIAIGSSGSPRTLRESGDRGDEYVESVVERADRRDALRALEERRAADLFEEQLRQDEITRRGVTPLEGQPRIFGPIGAALQGRFDTELANFSAATTRALEQNRLLEELGVFVDPDSTTFAPITEGYFARELDRLIDAIPPVTSGFAQLNIDLGELDEFLTNQLAAFRYLDRQAESDARFAKLLDFPDVADPLDIDLRDYSEALANQLDGILGEREPERDSLFHPDLWVGPDVADLLEYAAERRRLAEEEAAYQEDAARRVRESWVDAWADVGSYARSIFDIIREDSKEAYLSAAQELLRIIIRFDIARERQRALLTNTEPNVSNSTAFLRALVGGIPIFHGGRIPDSFSDKSEMLAVVRRNETIFTPNQLGEVLGSRGDTIVNMNVEQVISDEAVVRAIERNGYRVAMALGAV